VTNLDLQYLPAMRNINGQSQSRPDRIQTKCSSISHDCQHSDAPGNPFGGSIYVYICIHMYTLHPANHMRVHGEMERWRDGEVQMLE